MQFFDDRGNVKTEADLGYCGKDVIIKPTVVIAKPERVFLDDYALIDHYVVIKCGLRMGKHSKIGPHGFLNYGPGQAILGDFAEMGPACKLITGSNNYNGDDGLMAHGVPPEFSGNPSVGTVELKDHVTLGANTVILEGTTVPEGIYTGANTLLSSNMSLTPWTLYVGCPGKPLRAIDGEKLIAYKRALFTQRYGNPTPPAFAGRH